MSTPLSQLALQRVLDYLRLAGVRINPEVQKRALLLVLEALESMPEDPLAGSMRLLPEYFQLPEQPGLCQTPAIHRGSLGYGAY
ncbi:hypothetical protein [Halopseudomonas pelagia]|uniref:hypothetical protein n=1 Tax=Halopseudomonas pelagia TaxID=553151 RepID=UPI0030D973CF